jgi:hypothetical protein
MKELYSIKSGAYKTSKDYARLKELLDAGYYIVCFIRYDASDTMTFHDICLARRIDSGDVGYEFSSRGISYLTYFPKYHNFTFEEICKTDGVEFIEPTNISK